MASVAVKSCFGTNNSGVSRWSRRIWSTLRAITSSLVEMAELAAQGARAVRLTRVEFPHLGVEQVIEKE